MKTTKTLVLLTLALLPLAAMAQKRVEASVEADVLSRYVWRGLHRAGLSIHPTAEVRWQGLYLQATGSIGIHNEDVNEIDLWLGYRLAGFNIGVADYWETGIDPDNRYFYYDPEKGAHSYEGNLGYSCKYFSLQAFCTFYGNDYKLNGKQAYSTYIELSVPFRLGGIDFEVRGGMTPFESAGWKTEKTVQSLLSTKTVTVPEYLYADKTACTVAALRATKDIALGSVHLPVFAELNTNPYLQKAYLIFGLSVIPF